MSLAALINRPCVVIHRSSDDELDEFAAEQRVEDREETVCYLEQRQRTEPERQGELSETTWLVMLLAQIDVNTAAAVVVDGEVYEFVGDPWRVENPRTQQTSHVEATATHTGTDDEGS